MKKILVSIFIIAALSLALYGFQSNQATMSNSYSAWTYSTGGGAIGTARPGGSAGTALVISTLSSSTWTQRASYTNAGHYYPPALTFATLGTPTNGAQVYCSDCAIGAVCAGSGTGAMAARLNGVWVCN